MLPPHHDDFESEGPQGTRLENVDDLRRQFAARGGVSPTHPPAGALREPPVPTPVAVSVVAYRPVHRPPMALLTVFFDGREEGELVPLLGDRTVIGRSEGSVLIPHDGMMSTRHAEIVRVFDRGRWRWFLTDLDSTNGTYVRVAAALLKHEQEFLLGGRRFRFDSAHAGHRPEGTPTVKAEGSPTVQPQGSPTRGWQNVSPTDVLPSFVELTLGGAGQRYFITEEEHWIGSDPQQASIVLADDPLVNPCHARIARDSKGRWVLENAGSVNGVWLRSHRVPFEGAGQFQLGEQRFLLKPL